ncbi:hypothetical protein [Dactylosporangium sp. NPDC005555]|uniref:hypothetical protein n=1 Tax=Dactylosporangium sp. NPDC005555 TaxID=3154889 RepID=UPI00339FDF8A
MTVSPTKPLTPTHVKYLLSLDMLQRATSGSAAVTVAYRHANYAASPQVAGFWDHLERHHPDAVYSAMAEEDIGELYIAYHRAEDKPPHALIATTLDKAASGWVHPATARLLDIWEDHYRLLGLVDPFLGRHGPELADEADVLRLLVERHLCIDGRSCGAPVFLDGTAAGYPLRAIIGADGQRNYLLYLLRELIPLLDDYDLVVLAHDTELRTDYQIVQHVLVSLGAAVTRFEVPRVPTDGSTRSARHGGWRGYTLGSYAGALVAEFGLAAFRLGLRLYLVGSLGRTAKQSFSTEHARRWSRRATRLLADGGDGWDPATVAAAGVFLERAVARRGYADPNQVATAILGQGADVPVRGLAGIVLGTAIMRDPLSVRR